MISFEDGKKLIELAKKSILNFFDNIETEPEKYIKDNFFKEQGVFVTLHKKGDLRGCIGYPEPVMPLYDAIISGAISAAFKDSRFPPLKKEEFEDIDFEVSVLTVPEEIISSSESLPSKIKIGEDGLIIKGPYGSGLLLPQVFTEYNCTSKEALKMTCNKAGLDVNAWKESQNKIFKFQAQIFSE